MRCIGGLSKRWRKEESPTTDPSHPLPTPARVLYWGTVRVKSSGLFLIVGTIIDTLTSQIDLDTVDTSGGHSKICLGDPRVNLIIQGHGFCYG